MADANQVFDKIFYINSKKRVDRLKNIKKRLDENGIIAERFPAIFGGEIPDSQKNFGQNPRSLNLNEQGCFFSHTKIYELIKANGYGKTLILEDDAEFKEGFKDHFEKLYNCLPNDWDLLYFGQFNYDQNSGGKTKALQEKITDFIDYNIYTANRCWLTHAYAVNIKCIDKLIEGTKAMYSTIDNVLADLQKDLIVYAIHPALIKQDGSQSSLRMGVKTVEI